MVGASTIKIVFTDSMCMLYSQVVFEGVRGDGWKSDIALDDIGIQSGACSEPTRKYNMLHKI